MGATLKITAGTFLGIALAYGAYKGSVYVISSIKSQR